MQTGLLDTVVERAVDGRRLLYQVITCRKCGKEERFHVHTHKRLHPPQVIKKRALRLGWTLTDKLKDAVCPACLFYRAVLNKPTTPIEEKVEMSAPVNPVTLKAVPPAEPSRETNQLIHMALQEKYVGPDVGYMAGVTDQSLADDLKVPRAWVTKSVTHFSVLTSMRRWSLRPRPCGHRSTS